MEKIRSLTGKIPGLRKTVYKIRNNINRIKTHGGKIYSLHNYLLIDALCRYHFHKKNYRILSPEELLKTKASETVFIFGSGYSLNEISEKEWESIGQHNTLGLSGFIYQKWVRTDYHLIRGWVETFAGLHGWRKFTREYADSLEGNDLFKDAILIMQGDYTAQFCNQLLGYRYIKPGRKIYRFKSVRRAGLPTTSLQHGLRHAMGTICDAVNFAFCMGWKEIVLAGVDLYDNRYFWTPPDKTLNFDEEKKEFILADKNVRGLGYDQKHSTAHSGIIELMKEWGDFFKAYGVRMSVYNPRSLLREVLPLYEVKIKQD